jgi:hypothetical protein
MKERSLLYFITAVVSSVLFLVALLTRTQPWFIMYGSHAMPSLHTLFIPVVLLWVGWYFQSKGFLLSASIFLTVILTIFWDNSAGILNGDIHVISSYAPGVRTAFVLGSMLMIGTFATGFYTYLMGELKKDKVIVE